MMHAVRVREVRPVGDHRRHHDDGEQRRTRTHDRDTRAVHSGMRRIAAAETQRTSHTAPIPASSRPAKCTPMM